MIFATGWSLILIKIEFTYSPSWLKPLWNWETFGSRNNIFDSFYSTRVGRWAVQTNPTSSSHLWILWMVEYSTNTINTIGAEFYAEDASIPPKVSSMNLEIDRIFNQLQMQSALPEGFHIFHYSHNWIFATNVKEILKLLLSKFSEDFLHVPHWFIHL